MMHFRFESRKGDFCLKNGLADTSKTAIKVKTDKPDKRNKSGYVEIDKEVHKVQVLDPATGTGTFLAEVVKFIYGKKFKVMQGAWSGYVEEHLIPRLNGFELLMASYSMAHLKLDMLLNETGYQSQKNRRFNIFLTNSLEEFDKETPDLFSNWLSAEAKEANHVKRQTPVMVVMGNPPYSGESSNKGQWIMDLMEDYKKEPGGKEKLKERNSKWINDDYVKFLRYGQHFIEKNGEGVLAYINPHGFLDNPTFRGMRWNLLKTYDKIIIIDLHGNSKKKEVSPDGSLDVNVFDIQQGVAINFFIKTGKKKANDLAEVLHYDLYGTRESKYEFLNNNSLSDIDFENINNVSPMYYWIKKDFAKEKVYKKGFFIKDLFLNNSMGSTTGSDSEYVKMAPNEFDDKFNQEYIKQYSYRPFDTRYIFYKTDNLARAREKFMVSMDDKNIAMCLIRRDRGKIITGPVCSRNITDKCIASTLDNANIFPLFVNSDNDDEVINSKIPNLSSELVRVFASHISEDYNEICSKDDNLNPYTIFYYVLAVLNSRKYIKEFGEFIKVDFPSIPYPKNKKHFLTLSSLGKRVCDLELMDSDLLENYISSFPYDGSNDVTTKITKKDWALYDVESQLVRIRINEEQCFEGIPLEVWNLNVGGFQPAQKWIKDRSGRKLSYDDILHYQKIIVALNEKIKVVHEIDSCI
jgi:predicted helicase